MQTLAFFVCCLVQYGFMQRMQVSAADITYTLSSPNMELTRLFYDKRNDRIYLAATNAIYIRTASLQAVTKISIGPRNDSLMCPPDPNEQCTCPSSNDSVTEGCVRTLMDTTVKTMLLDRNGEDDMLIICTDRYYGSCSKIFLRNYRLDENFYIPVVSNSLIGEAIMLAPNNDGQVFVATSRDINSGLRSYKDQSHLISKRRLEDFSLSVYELNSGITSLLNVRPDIRDSFPVEFVYGFTHGEHSFFMGVRNNVDNRPKTFISRLCNADDTCRSYVELELACEENERLVAATYADMGLQLATELEKPSDGKYIYGLFTAVGTDGIGIPANSSQTYVCIFDVNEVILNMNTAIQLCNQGGQRYTGPSYIVADKECIRRDVSASVFLIIQ